MNQGFSSTLLGVGMKPDLAMRRNSPGRSSPRSPMSMLKGICASGHSLHILGFRV